MVDINKTVESINKELNLACDLTQQIIDLANQTELEELETLNQKRITLINSIFNNDKNRITVELAQKLLELNTQAMAVIKHKMAINMKEQKKSRKGNAAHSAYMNHS